MLNLHDKFVYLAREAAHYSHQPPFHPSDAFPEWAGSPLSREDNPAYRAVRKVFLYMNLDTGNYGSPSWNPLARLVTPGCRCVLKPNLVREMNPGNERNCLAGADCLITHGSITRAVLDYVAKAMNGAGTVLIADAPVQGCDWDTVVKVSGLDSIVKYARATWPRLEVDLVDLRLRRVIKNGGAVSRIFTDRDFGERYREIDLAEDSLLAPLAAKDCQFGVSQYSPYRMQRVHTSTVNKYLLSDAVLNADVLINLPKMKTHQKAGMTGALKNLVGINGHKDYLPHFRYGCPAKGGDEYENGNSLWKLRWAISHQEWEAQRGWERVLWSKIGILIQVFSYKWGLVRRERWAMGAGSWYGNDTLWRTILDINRALFYYDRARKIMGLKPWGGIRYLAILDGLVGGDGQGPLEPDPVPSGIVMAAHNPVALDTVQSALMGFDFFRIPQLASAYQMRSRPLASFVPEEIQIVGEGEPQSLADIGLAGLWRKFKPPRGWLNHIEARDCPSQSSALN